MEPFFFNSDNGRLFGVYHPSAGPVSRKAVVFCPPIFQDYFRTYRLLSNLAELWAEKGYHVLRFDYFGTGDSEGSLSDGGPQKWQNDIRTAVAELVEISGTDWVSIFGVRLGATLALNATAEIEEVKSAVVWDPISSGREYLMQLRNTQTQYLISLPNLAKAERNAAATDLSGFQSCDWFENELRDLVLDPTKVTGLQSLRAVLSHEENPLFSRYGEECSSSGVDVEIKHIAADCNWQSRRGTMLQVPELVAGVELCLK